MILMNNTATSGDFIDLLSVFSKQILPIIGVIALILLCKVLWELVKFVQGLDTTMDKVNDTIDSVDQSVEKLQVPLDTLENLSYSIDSVHEFTKSTIIKSVDMITDNFTIVKDWASSLFKKEEDVEETENFDVEIIDED